MKTLSLKMLLVAALVVAPAVKAEGNVDANTTATTQGTPAANVDAAAKAAADAAAKAAADAAAKAAADKAAADAAANNPNNKTVTTDAEGYLTKAGKVVSGVVTTVVGFPTQAWEEFSKAGILGKFAVLAATGYVGEKVYNYMTAQPKTKSVKAN